LQVEKKKVCVKIKRRKALEGGYGEISDLPILGAGGRRFKSSRRYKMGEIIIKIPENVKKTIKLNLPYVEILKRLGIDTLNDEVEFWNEKELKEVGEKFYSRSLLDLDDEDYSKW